jgi:DNA polymerase-3 subunit epsilon
MSRQVILDTETTGLEVSDGHRIIEIGCVELVDRRLSGRHFHRYINPRREVDPGAFEVHGISNEFLADKPVFAQVANEFLEFVGGAELIIHNAPFDVGFIDHELGLLGGGTRRIVEICSVIDTLAMARSRHPGQKNRLDDLCRRYAVDNSQRELHGALLDAEILADVYLRMTGGQTALALDGQGDAALSMSEGDIEVRPVGAGRPALVVLRANADERASHRERLLRIRKASGGKCLWPDEDGNAEAVSIL